MIKSSPQRDSFVSNGPLDRQFEKAQQDEDDDEGYKYVQQVRVYCEDLLRIMLRPESYELSRNTLGKLCELLTTLKTKDISPFNRSAFLKLSNLLDEANNPQVKVINNTHHTFDGTIGYAQAEDIRKFWKEKLQQAFVNAFRLAADFDAYGGTTRLFASEENIIAFPNGHTDRIKALQITSSGMAAAAESDGLIVGDGQIVITEWDQPKSLTRN